MSENAVKRQSQLTKPCAIRVIFQIKQYLLSLEETGKFSRCDTAHSSQR